MTNLPKTTEEITKEPFSRSSLVGLTQYVEKYFFTEEEYYALLNKAKQK